MTWSTERWAKLSPLFDELFDLDEAARASRLNEIARDDAALAADLRMLLAEDAQASGVLDRGIDAIAQTLVHELGVGEAQPELDASVTIGAYRIVRALGRGGMGVVYLAQRSEAGFEQQVALKLLPHGMDSADALRRFAQERRILAQLNHPHIARFIDGGVSADGRPFYAMEYIDGSSLSEFARAQQLSLRERVGLLVVVCDAVAYAHAQLVVHRDLKPSNILVDANGQPRVLDFGIAKLLDDAADAYATVTGMRAMSPAYAAPEQILGEPVSTATDVYALGVVAFELLTGTLPHRRTGSPEAMLRELGSESTLRPSQVIRQSTQARAGIDTARAARELAGDLDTIVLTALQREPQRRYVGASALAEDLRRWLAGRPIAARPDTTRYRMAKFVRRHRAGVAAAAVVLLSLIGALGVSLWQTHRAQQQSLRADTEAASARNSAQRATRVKDFLISVFTQEDPLRHTQGGATTLAQAFDEALKRIDTEFADDPLLQGDLLDDFGEITATKGDFQKAQTLFERALGLAERTHVANDPAIAETLVNLSVVIAYRGDVLAGKPYLLRAIDILETHALDRPNDYANALSSLGNVYNTEGNLAESERTFRRALEILRQNKAEPVRLIPALSNVAAAQLIQDHYADADASAREALELAEREFGKNSPNAIPPLWTLDVTASRRGDLDRARQLIERRLAIAQTALAPNHPWAVEALADLGDVQMRSGQFEQGLARLRQAQAMLHKSGITGQTMQRVQRQLWSGLRRHGDRTGAREAIEEAWKDCATQVNQLCLTVRANRAQSLAEAGQGEQALAEADAAVQGLTKLLGAQSTELAESIEARASALKTLHRLDAARDAQRKAIAMYEAIFGAPHPETQRAREVLTRI